MLALFVKEDVFIWAFGMGAVLIIALQAIINIVVVTGCFPMKGDGVTFHQLWRVEFCGDLWIVGAYYLTVCVRKRMESDRCCEGYPKIIPIEWI
jgi:hypothetical protein